MSERNPSIRSDAEAVSSPPNPSNISPGAAPANVLLRLIAIDGPVTGHSFTMSQSGAFLIGRSSLAQFLFPSGPQSDRSVSHSHCMIEFDPPLCQIHDLKSRNGTFVNGKRIRRCYLRDGDPLRIGRSTLRLDLYPSGEVEPPDWQAADDWQPPPAERPDRVALNSPICPACRQSSKMPDECLCTKCQAAADYMPQLIPGYRIVREIGRGVLGPVNLALSDKEGRAVALKIIDITACSPSPAQIARFLREADALRRLRHRHVVAVHDVGRAGNTLYVATDLVRGIDARQLLRRGVLSVSAAIRIVCQLLSALKYAHRNRFVHRDVKPANLLIKIKPDRKTVKVADFGLMWIFQNARFGGAILPSDLPGTTAYLAPEQVLDYRGATPAADQYAAAATLYYLLTKRHVYDRPRRVADQLAQILDEDVVPIRDRRSGLPPKLISVIHRALSRDPARRFPDVAAFKKALLPFGLA